MLLIYLYILAEAGEDRVGADPGEGAGVPDQQADEEDRETGGRHLVQTADSRAGQNQ